MLSVWKSDAGLSKLQPIFSKLTGPEFPDCPALFIFRELEQGEQIMLRRNNTKWCFRISSCFVLMTMLLIAVTAQNLSTGSIQGTVTDEQGAIVQGATVEARNVATNFSKTFTTDSDGRFNLLL